MNLVCHYSGPGHEPESVRRILRRKEGERETEMSNRTRSVKVLFYSVTFTAINCSGLCFPKAS